MGTAGEGEVQAEGMASEWPDTKAKGKLGLQGGQGQGREGHPPCTSALGRGTPARSSHTASGSASCSPCGRRLHGWGKKHVSSSSRRGQVGRRGFPPRGKWLLPSKVPPEQGPFTSGGAVSLTSKSSIPQDRTSNEQPQFSVLIPTPESVSRLMKLFQGSCTERQNSNQVRIKRIYRSGLGGIP